MAAFLVLCLAIAAAVIWLIGVPLWKGRRREAQARGAVPGQWQEWLTLHLPVYRRMPRELQQRLQGLVRVFVNEKTFVGCNGVVVTDLMRVVVAAGACLLILNRPGVPRAQLYDELYSILIYPTPFIVPHSMRNEHGLVTEERRVLSGQAWDSRRILLSWEDVEQSALAGHNVVLHEFAHYLDMEDESMDGAPGLGNAKAYGRWAEVFWAEYDQLRHMIATGQPTLIDPYGASAPAEFFAVVTEAFFQRSQELHAQHPALYGQLRSYYRLDPSTWPEPA